MVNPHQRIPMRYTWTCCDRTTKSSKSRNTYEASIDRQSQIHTGTSIQAYNITGGRVKLSARRAEFEKVMPIRLLSLENVHEGDLRRPERQLDASSPSRRSRRASCGGPRRHQSLSRLPGSHQRDGSSTAQCRILSLRRRSRRKLVCRLGMRS